MCETTMLHLFLYVFWAGLYKKDDNIDVIGLLLCMQVRTFAVFICYNWGNFIFCYARNENDVRLQLEEVACSFVCLFLSWYHMSTLTEITDALSMSFLSENCICDI